jgi:hypothetical protein
MRSSIVLRASTLSAAVFFLASATSSQATSFSDTAFNLADYSSTFYSGTTTPSSNVVQTSNGNPGTAYEANFQYGPAANGIDVLATALNNTFVYDPTVSGAISTLDVSLDRYAFPTRDGVNTGVGSYTLRVLILQGGNLYESSQALFGADAGGIWHTLSTTGLTASSFGLFDASNLNSIDFTTNPNFSSGPITFGFAMRNGGDGTPILQSATGILRGDNFSININSAAVPEPATWAMMIGGFGFAGSAMRRLRRSNKEQAFA